MKLRVLGCAGGSAPGRQLSGFLVDDALAVDAGSLTTGLDIPSQRRVKAVLVTHAHLDHCWSFPLFLANRFADEPHPVTVHGPPATLAAVRSHFFNDEVWPHDEKFTVQGTALAAWRPIQDEERREVLPGYEVTAIGLSHTVPTQGYLVRHARRSVIVCGDTGPTTRLWEVANAAEDLGGLVIECSFPSDEAWLAGVSGHLTPALLGEELRRLEKDVPVLVTHVKPDRREQVQDELAALGDGRIVVLEDGQVHDL
jgi:3',5'-cyclic-nucleotide phosphodiesterase